MERSNFTSEIPIYEIPGGIHPQEHKTRSNQQKIRLLPLANELVINLKGQAGNRSLPVVDIGDKVLKGQVIAECDGVFSAYQHAPTSGTIVAIENRTIAHPSGLEDLCIVIQPDGEDQWCELSPLLVKNGTVKNSVVKNNAAKSNLEGISREAILAQIFEKGIVGLGGASFPSHIKLKRKDGIQTLIINAAECEPYITCDDKLLQEHAAEVLQGAEIISKLYQDISIIVGIEDNKPEAIDALNSARQKLKLSNIKIGVVPTKYPSGGEKQLIQLLTGKEVPHGKLPADLGLVMHNVGTCYAIYQALTEGKPLVERLVTLTGDACQQPGNYWVPFGTPVAHLQNITNSENPKRLIMGGPMMGYELPSSNVGIVKATNCIIMSAEGELGMDQTALPCIRCGACMDACPASLLPQQLYWHAQADEFDKAEEYDLFDCIECGACAYVCPSHIPLVQYYRYAKSTIRNNRVEKIKAEKARQRHEARQERLERVKREKAERHRKAAEARKKAAAEAGKKDAKKAAVQAALERVKAKKKSESSSEKPAEEAPAEKASDEKTSDGKAEEEKRDDTDKNTPGEQS